MRGRVSAAALATALMLSGCGDDPESEVREAAQKTLGAGTATASLNTTGAIESTGEQRIDFATEETQGEFEFDKAPGLPPNTTAEIYSKGPDQMARYPTLFGKQWVLLPSNPLDDVSNNPSSLLTAFEVAVSDIEEVSKGTSDGIDVTRYRGTFDFEEFAETVPEEDQESANQTLEQFPITEIPVDVAVDADGYLRSVTFDFMGESGGVVLGADLSDFGEPVEFDPPDPDEVVPIEEIAGAQGEQS